MLSKLLFYPSLLYNVLLERVTSREWFTRIDNTVILGALPLKSIISKLQHENVKGIITLNEPFEMKYFVPNSKEFADAGFEQLVLATTDFTAAPTQENLKKGVQFIQKHRSMNNSVYVHCKAGRTRSTTLVACYLMTENEWTPDEAVQYIKQKRPHIWLRVTQFDALNKYFTDNTKTS